MPLIQWIMQNLSDGGSSSSINCIATTTASAQIIHNAVSNITSTCALTVSAEVIHNANINIVANSVVDTTASVIKNTTIVITNNCYLNASANVTESANSQISCNSIVTVEATVIVVDIERPPVLNPIFSSGGGSSIFWQPKKKKRIKIKLRINNTKYEQERYFDDEVVLSLVNIKVKTKGSSQKVKLVDLWRESNGKNCYSQK